MVLKQPLNVSISILFCYLQYMSYLYNGSAGIFVHVELVFFTNQKNIYRKFSRSTMHIKKSDYIKVYHQSSTRWLPLKEQQREIFLPRFFPWICSVFVPDFEAKRIFFSFSFSRNYSNILMNPRCRLLRGFKISAVAYCAYCHSPLQLVALMEESALQPTALIDDSRSSLQR